MNNASMTRRTHSNTRPSAREYGLAPILDRFFGSDPFRGEAVGFSGEDLMDRPWRPAVDVRETDEAFLLEAELPGLSKDDIHITLEDNVLRLSGERRFEKEETKDNYHRIERTYGSFNRSFNLGSGVKADKVQAAFDHGILTITVPKAEESKPRKIDIS